MPSSSMLRATTRDDNRFEHDQGEPAAGSARRSRRTARAPGGAKARRPRTWSTGRLSGRTLEEGGRDAEATSSARVDQRALNDENFATSNLKTTERVIEVCLAVLALPSRRRRDRSSHVDRYYACAGGRFLNLKAGVGATSSAGNSRRTGTQEARASDMEQCDECRCVSLVKPSVADGRRRSDSSAQ